MVGLSGCGVLWCASSWRVWCAGKSSGGAVVLGGAGFLSPSQERFDKHTTCSFTFPREVWEEASC